MEDEKLWQRMLSGKMYNDLSSELMRKRNDVVLLTNRYNRSYGEAQRVRESILRDILGGWVRMLILNPISDVSLVPIYL